jgi:hypothetical protein
MSNKRELKPKYVTVLVLLFISMIFTVPQAVGTHDIGEHPVITLLGDSPIDVAQGTVYTDAGATASDFEDGILTDDIITTNPVNTAVLGQYTVKYDVTDSDGNDAEQVTRTVNVVDMTPPEMVSARTVTTTSIEVEFSERVFDDNVPGNWAVADNTVTSSSSDYHTVTLNLGTPIGTGDIPLVTYTATGETVEDEAGNEAVPDSILPEDGISPEIVSAITISITSIDVTFSEDVIDDGASGNWFVDGNTVTDSFSIGSTVTLVLGTPIETGDTPLVTYMQTDTVEDLAGNAANDDSITPADGIPPVLSSVSIASTNTNPIYAKAADDIIVTFTASEPITTPSVTIAGNTATVLGGPTIWTASSTMDGTEDEGVVAFSIVFSDIPGNAGTTVVATTDPSSVTNDFTAPVPTLTIVRTDPDEDISPQPQRTFSRSVILDTECGDGPIGSGCDTFVVGGSGITNPTVGDFESFEPLRPATLTVYSGVKTVEISSVTDNAGNVAVGPFPDTIALDPRIVNVEMLDDGDAADDGATPFWEVDATFTGTVENIADPLLAGPDTVTFYFGSPTVEDIPIDDDDLDGTGTFFVTDSYLRISIDGDSHQPSAGLFNSGSAVVDSTENPVTFLGSSVTVRPHPVTSRLSHVGSAPVDESYSVRGVVDDDLPGFDNPSGLSVSFSDPAGTPLYIATTGGVTLEDPDGFEIDSCPDCVARLSDDSEIRFDVQRAPKAAVISLRDMGMTPDIVTFEVTTGPTPEDLDENEDTPPTLTGPPDVYDVVAESQVGNIALVTITNPNGVAKIKVKDSSDNEIGVSQIQTFTTSGEVVNNVEFSSNTASPIIGPQSYDNGRFFSEGLAPSPAATYLVTAQSAATLDYEASASEDIEPDSELPSHQRTLLTLTNPSSGFGGGTQPTELITLLTRTGSTCTADADGDAICNDWEDATPGIPFTVTTYPGGIATPTSCTYPITPAPIEGEKDLYYEIDAMTGHDPIDAARTAVITAFDSIGINLYLLENELDLSHVTTLSVWTDTSTPAVGEDIDDFNSIKNDRFGSPGERPTISTQDLQSTTVTGSGIASPASRTLTISGITVTTPNAGICSGTAGDDTQGRIVIGAKLTFTQSGVSVSAPASGLASLVAPGAGLNLRLSEATTQVITASTTVRHVIITIPFWTDSAISSVSMGTITLPMTITKSSWNGAITPTTLSGSPQITSTLLDARALVYRYMLFAHSQGGSSGAGETLGNDIVATLGSGFGGASDGFGGTQGTENEQAGTMMHEIGHNLGLAHGGKNTYTDSSINCKPNYPSIMTYSRQMDYYLGSAWVLEFSDGGLSSLEEDNLSDVPLVNSDADVPIVIWGSPGLPNPPTFQSELATLDKDWNDNGNEVDSGFSTDLTNFGIYGCGSPSPGDGIQTTPYFDHNDITDLRFNFGGLGGSFDGSPGSETYLEGDVAGRWQSIFGTFLFNKALSPAKATGIPTAKGGSSIPINFQLLQADNTPSTLVDNQPIQTPTPPTKGKALASVGCGGALSYTQFDDFEWIVKPTADQSHLQSIYKSKKSDINKTVCYKLIAIDDTVPGAPQERLLQNAISPLIVNGQTISGQFKLVK